MELLCKHCFRGFNPKDRRQRYCSKKCKKAAEALRQKQRLKILLPH